MGASREKDRETGRKRRDRRNRGWKPWNRLSQLGLWAPDRGPLGAV